MSAADIGGLLIAAALLAKSDLAKDILPVTPPAPPECPPGKVWDGKQCIPEQFGL